jgi:hypothetical protein
LSVVPWLLRGLLGLGCAALAYFAWPVAVGAWYAQQADLVINRLRDGKAINLPDALAPSAPSIAPSARIPAPGTILIVPNFSSARS